MKNLINKFFPLKTKRREFLKKIIKIMKWIKYKIKRFIIIIAKKMFKLIPSDDVKQDLRRIKNNTYFKSKKFLDNENINYVGTYNIISKFEREQSVTCSLEELDKSIAVHLHLYYEDLLDEFVKFLNNIPYKFDLYVSAPKSNDISKIEKKLQKVRNIEKIVIKKTPNKGRDFGPMIAEFGKKLSKYDYILHIHTKKSVRMGSIQDDWRRHLLIGVLGSENYIKNIFYTMENSNVGMVFPDTVDNTSTPYWGNSWLGASNLGRSVCKKLDIPFVDEYLNFSAGSMFWAKNEAIKDVFDLNLTWDDFEPEVGQADGTLPYVFERIFCLVSVKNKKDFLVYDTTKMNFNKNFGLRNMHQYYEIDSKSMVDKLKDYEVISFDIFDTLLTRTIYSPDDLFKIMNEKVRPLNIFEEDFIELRKQAEMNVRVNKKFVGDCSIVEIYDELKVMKKLNTETRDMLYNLEVELEEKCLVPRADMLKVFNTFKKMKKTIIILSDMYLTKEILEKILKKNGYTGYSELFVSSETGLRKDNATVWKLINKKYKGQKFVHIGDNEEADIHITIDNGKDAFHVMNSKKMLGLTTYGHELSQLNHGYGLGDSVLYGLIFNKQLFNSPFKFHKNENNYIIESLDDYGYSVIGPVIFYYLLWLIKGLKDSKETLLFLSREGYYLQKLYRTMKEKLNLDYLDNVKDNYFMVSRRAISIAQAKEDQDFYNIFDIEYYGDLKSILYYRFNLKFDKLKNREIILPRDKEFMVDFFEENKNKFYEVAEQERENYLKYINNNIKDLNNLTVIDLGYAGTTQMYLSKLLDKKVAGKYFVVTNKLKPLEIGCKMESCYNEIDKDMKNDNILYLNSLLLECFLTAPIGQLMYFDNEINPIHIEEKTIDKKIEDLDVIYAGVSRLITDMIDFCGADILNYEFNRDLIISNFKAFLLEKENFTHKNSDLFKFDDYYCRNDNINL